MNTLFLLKPLQYLQLVQFTPKDSIAYIALAQADPPALPNSFSKTDYSVKCDLNAAQALYDLAVLRCREATPVIADAIVKARRHASSIF
jgi:hypothetical protein